MHWSLRLLGREVVEFAEVERLRNQGSDGLTLVP
jgi:hypothetical protein